MSNTDPLDYILTDSLFFQPGETLSGSYKLFDETNDEKDSDLAGEKESALMRCMFSDDSIRRMLFAKLRVEQISHVLLDVKQPVIPQPLPKGFIPGDVDAILVIDESYRSIAIESKIVKITTINGKDDNINAAKVIHKGIEQANGLRTRCGFYQSYLLLLIKVDATNSRETNLFHRGAGESSWASIIDKFQNGPSLHEEVGLIIAELVQPTTKSFRALNRFGIPYVRFASPTSQEYELTNRISDLHQKPKTMKSHLVWPVPSE